MIRKVAAACLFALALAAEASAQEASPSEMAAARELFHQGLEAARLEQWAEARTFFERSYRVVPRNSTLLNLAGAQTQTHQLVRSAESYRRFIAEAGPGEASLLPSAEEALARVEARLARATIEVERLEDGDEVWLDDEVIGHGSLGVPLPVDPGEHVVTVARSGSPAAEARFSVEEGAATTVNVRLEAPVVSHLDAATDSGEDGIESLWSSPWLWLGVGAVVLAAILIPVIVAVGSSNSPHAGTLGAGTLTFE
jgi:hypothetical protein